MKKILSIAIIAMLVMAMMTSFAFAEETTIAGTPRSETLVVEGLDGVISNPDQASPYLSGTNFSAGLHQLVYSNLWEMDTINGTQISDLAIYPPTALTEDFSKWEVKLTQGIKWSDGEDFNADDVVFTINTLLENKDVLSAGASLATILESVEKVDDYTVIFNCVGSRPRITEELGSHTWGNFLRIIPEHYFSENDITTDLFSYPIGTGPYKRTAYDPNGYWFLYELREDAEYSDIGVLTGKVPQCKYVLFTAYGTEEKKTMAMLNSEVDILCDISPESWEVLLEGNPNVACWLPDYPYGCFDDPCERGMMINCAIEPYNNSQVRWAMALSLDMVQCSMDTFSGQMRVSPICMPPTTFMMNDYHNVLRDDLVAYTWEDGYQPFDKDYALKLYDVLIDEGYDAVEGMSEEELVQLFGIGWWKYDTAKAEELMVAAGCERNADGKWTYNGEVLSFSIICPSGFEAQSERLAYACADQWAAFGFDATVQASESGLFNSADDLGEYTVGSYWPSCGVMQDLYSQLKGWHSQYYTPIGETAIGTTARFTSEKLDAVLDAMAPMAPSAETYELSKEAMMIMADEVAWLPMFGTSKLVPTCSTYWTNYPDSENPYNGPWWWWSCFKYIVNEFQPVA